MKTNKTELVTRLPARLEPFGENGWTVFGFATAEDAAAWFLSYPAAAMPCWKRFEVIGGRLMQVR